ncbi:hypothetical protein, partial [Plasmodium yoelii yoelii]
TFCKFFCISNASLERNLLLFEDFSVILLYG